MQNKVMKDGRLQASDLMVGDWVKLSKGNWFENRKVELIDIEMIAESVYLAEPIPITPEILKKNGFEWTTRKSYMVSCIGTVRMIWGFYKDCLSISDNSDDGECQISSLKCKFVHELQHALRLCKIEKEIGL